MRKIIWILAAAAGLAAPARAADTYTTRLGITKPALSSLNWGGKLNSNFDVLDASAAVQGLTNTFASTNTFNGLVQHSSHVYVNNTSSAVVGGTSLSNTERLTVIGGGVRVDTGTAIGVPLMFISSGTGATPPGVGIGVLVVAAALHVRSTSTTSSQDALRVDNQSGTSLIHVRQDGGVGIASSTPVGLLDVAGTINGNTYARGGVSGTSLSCSAGQSIGTAIVQGGIVTGGTCAASGGGDFVLASSQTIAGANTVTSSLTVSGTYAALVLNSSTTINGTVFGTINKSTFTLIDTDSAVVAGAGVGPCVPRSSVTLVLAAPSVLRIEFLGQTAHTGSSGRVDVSVLQDGQFIDSYTSALPMITSKQTGTTANAIYPTTINYRTHTAVAAGTHNYCLTVGSSGATGRIDCTSGAPCHFAISESK